MGSKFGTVTIENHLPVPITNSRLTQTVPDILISGTEQINPGQRKVIEIPEVAGSSGIWGGQILSAAGVPELLSCRFERCSEHFKQSAASTTPDVRGEVVSYPHKMQCSEGTIIWRWAFPTTHSYAVDLQEL